MNLYQPTISGSLTVSGSVEIIGPFTMSGGSISGTSSFAANAGLLQGLDSTSFVGTGSFNTMSSSVSTRVTTIESKYATTGSNIFTGAQTVCANITSTGTIIAQTLNVQQVTSSVVYSSGSNIFGCDLANVQQFTGSVNITGSLSNTGCTILNNPVLIKYPNTDVNAIQICATTGTNASAMVFSNSGGNFYVGKDNSTGGRIVLSAVPYANAIWAENCCAISFGVGNVERLRINCSDIINIGSITSTNNKTIQFQVDTSLSYSGRIQMSNDTSILYLNGGGNIGYNFGAGIELVGKDRYACCHGGQLTLRAGNSVNNASFGYIAFETCNTERMRITSGGNVLIAGTSTNGSPILQIDKCDNTTNGSSYFWNTYSSGMMIRNSSTTTDTLTPIYFYMGSGNNSIAGIAGIQEASTLGALGFFTGGSGRSNTVPERMRITSAGDVLIARTGSLATSTTTSKLVVGGPVNLGSGVNNTSFPTKDDGGLGVYVGSGANAFQVWDDNQFSYPRFIVQRGGNVGIGASSPSSILELCAATPIMTLNQTTGNSNQGINFNNGATTYGKITNNAATGVMTIQNGNATGDGYLIRFITDGNERLRLGTTGIACFACQVCAPNFITTGGCASVRGGDPAFFRGSTVTQSGNSITFDAFRFLNPTGGVGGAASSISGRLYMSFHDTSTGGNQVSYQYLIITTGNGVSPGPYCFVQLYCGPVRGTNPISAISLVNDGAGGAVKVQATTAASGVAGAVAYITYVGTAV